MVFHLRSLAYALVAISLAAPLAAAQNMTIRADLTEAPRGLIRGTLSIPVKPGPLTLVYPQWIPGYHSPIGPITDLAASQVHRRGQADRLAPRPGRHVRLPRRYSAGATTARCRASNTSAPTGGDRARSQHSEPARRCSNGTSSRFSPRAATHPKSRSSRRSSCPPGWKFGCSMEKRPRSPGDGAIHFKPVSLEMLIDQPVIAGRHFKQLDLTPGATPQHVIDIAADSEAALAISAERLKAYQRVPAEYAALFGARHYERYHFLLALSDRTGYQRPGASSMLRQPRTERALIDDDIFTDFAEPADARVLPFLERQASPAGRLCSRPTIRSRCRTTCSGSTKVSRNTTAT